MEPDYFFELLSTNRFTLLIAAGALIVAIIALFSGASAQRRLSEHNDAIKLRVDSLWQDMDEMRVSQFNGPGPSSAQQDVTSSERFVLEKAAYEAIWPLVWSLHDKLGMFLRAVETEEHAGELRLEARNAALEARKSLNRVRPFCHHEIDDLITQLIDNQIKAHLAACHFMDLSKDAKDSLSSSTSHERAVQKEKFRMLYDGQSRDMLDQLVRTIRQRMLR